MTNGRILAMIEVSSRERDVLGYVICVCGDSGICPSPICIGVWSECLSEYGVRLTEGECGICKDGETICRLEFWNNPRGVMMDG